MKPRLLKVVSLLLIGMLVFPLAGCKVLDTAGEAFGKALGGEAGYWLFWTLIAARPIPTCPDGTPPPCIEHWPRTFAM